MTKEELQAAVDAVPYWYHKIELPHGITTPGWAPMNPAAYRIPENLCGKTVLDVGAWDGYWSFEAIKRGASRVTAIDDFSDTIGAATNADRSEKWKSFCTVAKALGFTAKNRCLENESSQRIEFYNVDIQDFADIELSGASMLYDHIFLFGLLYHLRHPLLALENVVEILKPGGTIHIETAILDGCTSPYSEHEYTSADCAFGFYPNSEYGMNPSNWWVGTLKAWCGLVEAAGFKNIEHWKLTDNPQHVSQSRGFIRASV